MSRHLSAKIFLSFTISVIVISIAAYFFGKPVIMHLAEKQLRNVFKESSVSISGFKIAAAFIEFRGIEIKQEKSHHFKIGRARIYYSLKDVFKKKIGKILLEDAYIRIAMDKDCNSGFYPFPVPGAGKGKGPAFSLSKVEARNMNLDLNKGSMNIRASASLQMDVPKKTIDYIKLNDSSLNTDLFHADGMTLSAAQDQDAGEFYVHAVNYNKLKIGNIAGKSKLKGSKLYIKPILISFLGGSMKGELDISLDQNISYELMLDSHELDIKRFVDDMKLAEKFSMTGRIDGEFYASGACQEIKNIKGNFHTDGKGGVLVINDKTFLENIARRSNQPLDIIVESFRNYNYNNGVIKLFMENNDLVMDIRLRGVSGKRSLAVILHDIKKGKETP